MSRSTNKSSKRGVLGQLNSNQVNQNDNLISEHDNNKVSY